MKNKRRASLRKIISNINLSKTEEVLKSKYKYTPDKPGKPPLSPTKNVTIIHNNNPKNEIIPKTTKHFKKNNF